MVVSQVIGDRQVTIIHDLDDLVYLHFRKPPYMYDIILFVVAKARRFTVQSSNHKTM
jgi:hypothetical protein